ncbi:DASH family cryptochrome [Mucilaginibacter sp.]|jgi:deoxyribodipyrimidine photo-lyase|uniref:DASH family cryptochrome n=1 Tax=Mucilaginibacter sp. TaxID=1882438 RepID=UPI002CBA557D|nr:DASH family cryptochrome [Mucilaginibacter sp.]HTI59841.1 DASH family cryptochrome [Mucilaginibacter sp.]
MSGKTILVWFRNDLRIHDNEILLEATKKADKVLPVYCFDPFYFKKTDLGLDKTGSIRARFLLESVANLRKNLHKLGSELVVRTGDPAEIIPQLAQQYQVSEVYHHREVAYEETEISEAVETALWKIKLNLKHFIGHTLYHKEDLPFPIKDIPDSFATFKKKIERDSDVRPCIETPRHIITPEIAEAGNIPTLTELGLRTPDADPRVDFHYEGGETAALRQMHHYISSLDNMPVHKGARHMSDAPSRLSAWISLGCLSQRMVYHEVTKHANGVHTSGSPLILELLWRDYFRFMFKKHGRQFFNAAGINGDVAQPPAGGDEVFELWKNGHTGVPFVDAAMHELNATGYITNNKRQIVAAFLINTLKTDWREGAAYFEEKLIDYSPASNFGNWAFVAGVANHTRDNRYFASVKMAEKPETESDFISTWLPEINDSNSLVEV